MSNGPRTRSQKENIVPNNARRRAQLWQMELAVINAPGNFRRKEL
jgi:hypothetical protein